jgi:pSer/pThr/pTyr-binding forkhead associated (FHA) protein
VSRLVIYEGDMQRAEHQLAGAVVGLGRHPKNDIVLDDRTLSRFHARIERREGDYIVVDLGAQNGVHLNGSRIEGEASLQYGDRIDLGRYTAVFHAPIAKPGNGPKVNQSPKNRSTAPPPREALDVDLDVDLDLGLDLDAGDDLLGTPGLDRSVPDDSFNEASQVEYLPPQPTLVLLFNGLEMSRHPMLDTGLIVGRSKQSDVVISLLGLSRRHSRIVSGDEGVTVEDLGSQNGTWVNNERIEGSRLLKHGDMLNFYDYSLLFLEDGDVEVGFPGAGFSPPESGDDELGIVAPAPAGSVPAEVARPQRYSLADDVPPDDATALGRNRPRRRTDEGLNLDDLGEGSYLGDEFEEGASKQRRTPLLDDDDLDDVMAPAPTPARARAVDPMGTDIIATPDLSRGADDEDLEADIAFSSSVSDDFVGPATAGDVLRLRDKTSTAMEQQEGSREWPSDDDLERAMMVLEATSATLEVSLKGRSYAQIPLSQPVMRLGSDPRCEISMPKASGLRPWHVTFSQVGATILVVRSNGAALVEQDGREVDAAILGNGDTLKMGKVEIMLRLRR